MTRSAIQAVLLALALLAPTAGAGAAPSGLPPLAEDPRIKREFLAVAVGDEIRKNCPTISARLVRVWRKAHELEAYAVSLGYGAEDITAMRKDPANKQRLRELRDAYLAENGVIAGVADSYCRLGLEEIEKNSLTGWLLYAK